eukprot:CAMPEP_0172297570 /NCGR_PEP_ID=MMETSP1058-20130122/537_1 /TAXON_ID=83371 /ORGANISM="Detonula confervacea, Strain CCMP 353" /LENGTH=145 /DNA_ID=CAMNT_0013006735 /DNA_START=222 /DNA_END=659 /DNA_ORIENTATION=-
MATYIIVFGMVLNSANNVAAAQKLRQLQDTNSYFCGSSGTDVNNNCSERQSCASDDECDIPGHFCLGSTLCDASQIENAKEAKRLEMEQMLVMLVPDDPIRFNSCGTSWTDASAKCGVWCWSKATECPNGEGCFPDTLCYNDAWL